MIYTILETNKSKAKQPAKQELWAVNAISAACVLIFLGSGKLFNGNFYFKWNLSVQFMDGPTFYMQQLVVTSKNMVTELQKFGFTQKQKKKLHICSQLLGDMQTIVTIVMLCPFIDQTHHVIQ